MTSSFKTALTRLLPIASAAIFAACAPANDDADDNNNNDEAVEAQSDELNASVAGHYRLKVGSADSADRWIQEVNLHADGTYEGNFGNDVSNLSGHHYVTAGTYRVKKTTSGTTTLIFNGDSYGMRPKNDGSIELRFEGYQPAQPWFTMTKGAAPVTITFAPNGAPTTNGPLVGGRTALILYSTSRVHCASTHDPGQSQSWLAGFYGSNATHGIPNGWLDWGLSGAVKGYYRALISIPRATDLALWFQDHAPTCDHWDSNFGHNYHLAVQ